MKETLILELGCVQLDIAVGKGMRKAIHHYREHLRVDSRPQIVTGIQGRDEING